MSTASEIKIKHEASTRTIRELKTSMYPQYSGDLQSVILFADGSTLDLFEEVIEPVDVLEEDGVYVYTFDVPIQDINDTPTWTYVPDVEIQLVKGVSVIKSTYSLVFKYDSIHEIILCAFAEKQPTRFEAARVFSAASENLADRIDQSILKSLSDK